MPIARNSKNPKPQHRIPSAYYRGGTSRGLVFHAHDLPGDRTAWDPIFRGTLGSPDSYGRQLDGLGGGISSLSKICVVGPATTRDDAHVDFTFVQVGVRDGGVDYSGNCGNLTSAVGPYAVDRGLVDLRDVVVNAERSPEGNDGTATVRIYNTNTDKLVESTFPVSVCDGEAAVAEGDFAIDGVAGTGARIKLDFLYPAGSKTGTMLPTGNVVDIIDGVRATCIDVGNPCIFLSASELDIDGTVLPDVLSSREQSAFLSRLERIRAQAAVKMGMATSTENVPASIPKVCFVSPPSTHRLLSGDLLRGEYEVDIVVRAISMGQPHKALPITAGLAMSAAAGVEGSAVQTCLEEFRSQRSASTVAASDGENELVIGHASGKLDVGAKFVHGPGGKRELERVTVFRTARRLMEGHVYWK